MQLTPGVLRKKEIYMTHRERWVRWMHFQPVDYIPDEEFGYWAENFRSSSQILHRGCSLRVESASIAPIVLYESYISPFFLIRLV